MFCRGKGAARRATFGLGVLALATCALAQDAGPGVGAEGRGPTPTLPSPAELAARFDEARFRATVEELAAAPTRLTGTPGCDAAAELVRRRLVGLGIEEVFDLPYTSVVPVDKGASLALPDGRTLELACFWPNNIRTPTTRPEGITARLIAPPGARPRDLDGLDVEGSIVVLPFDCGADWLNAPLLGARAVIFLEPRDARYDEARHKFVSVPLSCPRLWAPRALRDELLSAAQDGAEVTLTARMDWEVRPAVDVIAVIRGTDPVVAERCHIVTSHFDSVSVVPSLAPGAEGALGIATLLEVAGVLADHPPQRSVVLLACSGHYEAFEGARQFINCFKRAEIDPDVEFTTSNARFADNFEDFALQATQHARKQAAYDFVVEHDLPVSEQTDFVFDIDIGSASDRMIGLYKSGLYSDRAGQAAINENYIALRMSRCAQHLQAVSDSVAESLGVPAETFAEGVNPLKGRTWRGYVIPDYAAAIEAFQIAGAPGLTLATVADPHLRVDTPHDSVDHVRWPNAVRQGRFITALVPTFFHDFLPPKRQPAAHSPEVNWSNLTLQTVIFDPKQSYLPDTPQPGTFVVHREADLTLCGVRGFFIEQSDENACAEVFGIHMKDTDAYVVEPETGDIVMARDFGFEAQKGMSQRAWIGGEDNAYSCLLLPCRSATLFETVDPRFLRSLGDSEGYDVFDAANDSMPQRFGFSRQQEYVWKTDVTPLLSVFMPRHKRFKAVLKVGLLGKRMVLIGAREDQPEGVGYPVAGEPIIRTSYVAARDMWLLDDSRMATLRKYGIANQRLDGLHAEAKVSLDAAEAALGERRFSDFLAKAHRAWAYESRAYPDVNATSQDVVKGIVFYMAMLLPFAFFAERLIFDFADIRKQLAGAGFIFLAIAILIRFVHPAFDITLTPVLILLSFVTLALSLIVTSLIANRFQDEINRLRRMATGIHTADVGRISATKAAFGLGISNMRRRRGRTLLTCITLVLLMFTVLSFTSVTPSLRDNKIRLAHEPAYEGLLVRQQSWGPLERPALDLLDNEFAGEANLAPRAWYTSRRIGERTFVTVSRDGADYDAAALLGLTPDEAGVSGVGDLLRAGTWLSGAELECVLPSPMAEALGVADEDVGAATVGMFGLDFVVRGVLAEGALDSFVDLDGENLTPVLYERLHKEADENQITKGGFEIPQTQIRRYDHMSSRSVAVVPYDTAVALGAYTRSLAMTLPDPGRLAEVISDLTKRMGLIIFAGQGGTAYQYSSTDATTLRGDPVLLIPLMIAALIVLNTMLGAVYERTGEIAIYSSVGLAPVHVSALFIAESCVYAVIGAIAGYLVGQGVSKIVVGLDLLPGLSLNYSSLSAVFSTMVVMAVVIASTLYPAAKASSMAVPDVHRRWELSEPEGDDWVIELPFTFSDGQEVGVNAFLHDFFANHTEDVGLDDFYSEGSALSLERAAGGHVVRLGQDVWLAPFDLGISQHAVLVTTPMDENVYTVELHLRRLSGDVASWKRMNRLFLNVLRKQYLIWRTLGPESQEHFSDRGRSALGV